ncbi:MAG: hypothetical protein RMI74_03210 [Thermodesulfobacterium sp.]|nr:hypothetical protein [Thermodesulfobacterium sp.]
MLIKIGLAYEDSIEKRVNLWPFLVLNKNKLSSYQRLEILGPLFYKYSGSKENGTSIRPFISWVSTPQEKKTFFLSPLGLYRSDSERRTLRLIPLISKSSEKRPSSEVKKGEHFDFFPIFIGKTSEGKLYGGFFPFYGKFKERFGKEEITFILWPFYTKVRYEEYTSKNYLWPIFKTIKGEKHRGFKIWPLYGSFQEKERKRSFFLWPFYIRESAYYSEGDFEEKWMFFPFYIKEERPEFRRRIVLWPFFQKVQAEKPDYKQIDAPWPFYRKIEGENIQGWRFWPFYGYLKREESLERFILWPFYFYNENIFSKGHSSYYEKQHRFLLFSKKYSQYEKETLLQTETRLWPFYHSHEELSQDLYLFYFPALLPFYDEGVERNYAPFLKLIEYYKKGNYSFLKLLWGLYRYEKEGERRVQELAFLIRLVRDINTNYLEIGEGFLGFGKIEGKPVVKIFFIKIK